MACDIRLASDSARFGQPEINLGIIPGFAGSQLLPRLIGKGRALEMLLTGEMIDAAEAYRIGLVNRILPASELSPAAQALARQVADKGQIAVRLCREAVRDGLRGQQVSKLTVSLFALLRAIRRREWLLFWKSARRVSRAADCRIVAWGRSC